MWNILTITRGGKVSILRDLDLELARSTYKALRPHEHPTTWLKPECCKDDENRMYVGEGGWSMIDDGTIDQVHVFGPPGEELNAWHGVTPKVKYYRCTCKRKFHG
jgi:hypothetical protein